MEILSRLPKQEKLMMNSVRLWYTNQHGALVTEFVQQVLMLRGFCCYSNKTIIQPYAVSALISVILTTLMTRPDCMAPCV